MGRDLSRCCLRRLIRFEPLADGWGRLKAFAEIPVDDRKQTICTSTGGDRPFAFPALVAGGNSLSFTGGMPSVRCDEAIGECMRAADFPAIEGANVLLLISQRPFSLVLIR